MPWKGCKEMAVRATPEVKLSDELLAAIAKEDSDNSILLSGTLESTAQKHRRLLREGRLHAYRVTNESYRYVTDARFHPSGDKVVATKWYTSEARSIGAGEVWEYDVPSPEDIDTAKPGKTGKIPANSGKFRIGRTLPAGWTAERYGDVQVGPEQGIWVSNDTIVYTKNIVDEPGGRFVYSKGLSSNVVSSTLTQAWRFRYSQRHIQYLLSQHHFRRKRQISLWKPPRNFA